MSTEALPDPPTVAATVFGDRLPAATRFAEILADTGVGHGLIGPREVLRLWERHLLGCAVLAAAFEQPGATVVDVGSGAGLPGIAVAIVRPDLRLILIEPMLRRTDWLTATVDDLGLDNVEVRRARAEELHGRLVAPYVTARAVARLTKLIGWCAPLLAPGGRLVAMKGAAAEEELTEAASMMRRHNLVGRGVAEYGAPPLAEPTRAVLLDREPRAVTPWRAREPRGRRPGNR